MKMTPGLTSSLTDEWATPQDLFNTLHSEFNFNLDVCADLNNHKVPKYFDKDMNGLIQDWGTHTCWMNPPYGRDIIKWVKKAAISARGGAVVVGLLPARTDTKWWGYVMQASELRFIKGRLKFGNSKTAAPFPSVIAIWGTPTTPVIKVIQ